MQWPDDFDWESTRAINRPVSTVKKTHEEKHDPDRDSYHTSEDELDIVALNKAFKFAAISSVALVSFDLI